jgi:hypothetical protein
MLIRLIYVSEPVGSVNKDSLEAIHNTARLANSLRDLTGMLVFDHQHYLQVIEGTRESVSQLLCNIMADKRHTRVVVISFQEISRRLFPEWSMEFVPAHLATKELLLRHTESSRFAPYAFTSTSALAFLTDMRGLKTEVAMSTTN